MGIYLVPTVVLVTVVVVIVKLIVNSAVIVVIQYYIIKLTILHVRHLCRSSQSNHSWSSLSSITPPMHN